MEKKIKRKVVYLRVPKTCILSFIFLVDPQMCLSYVMFDLPISTMWLLALYALVFT